MLEKRKKMLRKYLNKEEKPEKIIKVSMRGTKNGREKEKCEVAR